MMHIPQDSDKAVGSTDYVAGGLAPAPGGESNMCQKKWPMDFFGSLSVIFDRTEPNTVIRKKCRGGCEIDCVRPGGLKRRVELTGRTRTLERLGMHHAERLFFAATLWFVIS